MIINLKEFLRLAPLRKPRVIERRFMKLVEEVGELNEAYLSRTTSNNPKNISYTDYVDELADCLVLLLDIYYHTHGYESLTAAEVDLQISLERKLKKWRNSPQKDITVE